MGSARPGTRDDLEFSGNAQIRQSNRPYPLFYGITIIYLELSTSKTAAIGTRAATNGERSVVSGQNANRTVAGLTLECDLSKLDHAMMSRLPHPALLETSCAVGNHAIRRVHARKIPSRQGSPFAAEPGKAKREPQLPIPGVMVHAVVQPSHFRVCRHFSTCKPGERFCKASTPSGGNNGPLRTPTQALEDHARQPVGLNKVDRFPQAENDEP
ncbi:hypothetical protein P153DRAFT_385261 [Dothidotthia symphoricarpi CBS 119687]|uniref:Uncharacterized protein n=1 Tax=Dothidotthia symphoricarpi CBS 119687 TaxID=1392245 RepID=A0A6A6AGJ8_9PLEO|nr:uncharacterized protein P153DRAFT_385261 [Dothidotthia symphoricarpi CBS 119687]KAF2130027.1 hypothetical protein P153DRAFT_385261 [Dothidotthia symphoricarpi CBS 119687]